MIYKDHVKGILLAVAVIMLIIGSISAYAAVKTSTGVKNTFATGGINISIDAKTKGADGQERDGKTVVDYNGSAEYVPTVSNHAEPCYVRVQISADTDSQKIDIIPDLYGIDEDWKLIGEYLYYTLPLENDDSADICQGFNVPADWDYMASNDMRIRITADAIQAKNINPDFTKQNPWGDTAIAESQIGDDYTINAMAPAEGDGSIKVVYANVVDGITINTDDFFADVAFMPGDEYEDTLTISNKTSKPASVLFKIDFKDSPLLDILQMDINSGKKFYKGIVANDGLREYQQIAELDPGQSQEIDVTLALPASADNSYQVNNDVATWYFAIEQEQDKGVKTGDSIALWLLTGICFISAAVILIITRRSNRNV